MNAILSVALQQNSNRRKRVELWAKSINKMISGILDAISPARHPQKSSQHVCTCVDGAICSKNRKIVPHHRASPNTRNGARLRSPSPIMAPVDAHLKRKALKQSSTSSCFKIFNCQVPGFLNKSAPASRLYYAEAKKIRSQPIFRTNIHDKKAVLYVYKA